MLRKPPDPHFYVVAHSALRMGKHAYGISGPIVSLGPESNNTKNGMDVLFYSSKVVTIFMYPQKIIFLIELL